MEFVTSSGLGRKLPSFSWDLLELLWRSLRPEAGLLLFKEVVTSSTNFRPNVGTPKPIVVDAQNYRPPMVFLTGPDPSSKKSNKVFGVNLGSEMNLRAALCSPNLPNGGVSKGFANVMVDVIATPGGLCGMSTKADSTAEMTFLGDAMEELVNQGRSQTEEVARKADLHWRRGKLSIGETANAGHCAKFLSWTLFKSAWRSYSRCAIRSRST